MLAAWVVVLVVALPIASHQTDHLTGGGFDVPGSQSEAVSRRRSKTNSADAPTAIGVVLKADRSASPAARAAAVDRVGAAVAEVDGVTLPAADGAPRRGAAAADRNRAASRCAAARAATS